MFIANSGVLGYGPVTTLLEIKGEESEKMTPRFVRYAIARVQSNVSSLLRASPDTVAVRVELHPPDKVFSVGL